MANQYLIETWEKPEGRQRFYWRLRRGRQKLAPSEGYVRRIDRDKVAKNLLEAFRPGRARLVEVKPPVKLA